MPTTVTSSIGSAGGRDYSTIQAWEDACPANLVTDDKVWKGALYNDSEFAPVTISGMTTDATRYVWLTTAAGQSFRDHANVLTNSIRYDQSKGVAIKFSAIYGHVFTVAAGVYALIENVQLSYANDNANAYNQPEMLTENTTLRNFIYYTIRHGNSCIRVRGGTMINGTIIQDASFASGAGPAGRKGQIIQSNNASYNPTLIGLNVVRSGFFGADGIGIHMRYAGYPLVIDCALFNLGTPFDGTLASYVSGTSYNASDVASASMPGSNNQDSLTFADQYNDVITTETSTGSGVGSGDLDIRPKAGSALLNNGQRQNTYTSDLDMVGQARSTTTPTIGSWEGIGALPSAPVPAFRWFFGG
jgi:hypothetical protein